MSSTSNPEFLTPQHIAQECRLGYRTVLRAIEDGELPAVKLRNRLRIRQEDYDAWLTSSTVKLAERPTVPEPEASAAGILAP